MKVRMSVLIWFVLGAFVFAGACDEEQKKDGDKPKTADAKKDDGKEAKAKPTSRNPSVIKMASYADILCGCKDASCAKGVHGTYTAWVGKVSADKLEKADSDAWKSQQARLVKCWTKYGEAKVAVALDLTKPADVIKKLGQLKVEMCACKDAKCADAVHKQLVALRSTINKDVIEKVGKAGNVLYELYKECRKRARLGGSKEARNMAGFASNMCACKDARCANDVNKRMVAWIATNFRGGKKRGTKANVMRWKEAQKRYAGCYKNLLEVTTKTPVSKGADSEKMERYAQEMCACSRAMCAVRVSRKFQPWLVAYMKRAVNGLGAKQSLRRIVDVQKRISACMAQAMRR